MSDLPKWAYLKGRGKVRVLEYAGDGRFYVLTNQDEKILVQRERLIFTKEE